MFNPFKPIEIIKAEVFTSLPHEFRDKRHTSWSDCNRHGQQVDCFLEGPSFDRNGNLLVVDIPFGRIFRISPHGVWDLVVQYDGWPNGLKLHKDGRAFIADYRRGIMVLDMATGAIAPFLETAYSEGFKGVNDLHFVPNGDLYFTDQGQTGIADATGRVFRLRADGNLEKLIANAPSPNGLSYNATTNQLYVAVTRGQQVWRLPLMADGQPSKVGVAIQLSGGIGPDGIEVDSEGGLIVSHVGIGVWRFDASGLPTHLIVGPEGSILTNVAFGGEDGKTLFITDSQNGQILRARLPVCGNRMYGLTD
jgi:gluconolactonase